MACKSGDWPCSHPHCFLFTGRIHLALRFGSSAWGDFNGYSGHNYDNVTLAAGEVIMSALVNVGNYYGEIQIWGLQLTSSLGNTYGGWGGWGGSHAAGIGMSSRSNISRSFLIVSARSSGSTPCCWHSSENVVM